MDFQYRDLTVGKRLAELVFMFHHVFRQFYISGVLILQFILRHKKQHPSSQACLEQQIDAPLLIVNVVLNNRIQQHSYNWKATLTCRAYPQALI